MTTTDIILLIIIGAELLIGFGLVLFHHPERHVQ